MAKNPHSVANFGFHFGLSAKKLAEALEQASKSMKQFGQAMSMQSARDIIRQKPDVTRLFGIHFVTEYESIPLQDATARIWNRVQGVVSTAPDRIVYTSIGAFTTTYTTVTGRHPSGQSIKLQWKPGTTFKL